MSDRRRYPRVEADVLSRPTGARLFHHQRYPRDVSLGGMRVYSDELFSVGNRLDLDVLLPDDKPVRCWAEVVWVGELGPEGPAKFDIGLKFIDMAENDVQRLAAALLSSR